MVGLGRVELPTYGLGNRRSIHLSYSPGKIELLVYLDFAKWWRRFRVQRTQRWRLEAGSILTQRTGYDSWRAIGRLRKHTSCAVIPNEAKSP